jgi:glycosyltransferase involved in cell wall biosynthesis
MPRPFDRRERREAVTVSCRPAGGVPGPGDRHPGLRILGIADVDYVHTRKWANYFGSRGNRLHLVSFGPVVAQGRSEFHPNITVDEEVLPAFHLKRPWLTLGAIRRLRATSRRFRPDLVHVHYLGHAAWYAALANLRPLIVSVMGGGDIQGDAWQPASIRERLLTPFTLRRCDGVTCWSRNLARIVAPLLRPGVRPEVLVGGIDLSRFQHVADATTFRETLGFERDAFLIFSPRLFWPRCNIETIVRALPRVLARLPRARLLLVKHRASAYPEHEQAMERLIDALGVRQAVRSVPGVPNEEMPKYYSAASCTVSIPATDGTPMTVLESAACGTPTIVLDLPDYDPEIFVHGRSVLRLPLADPEMLANAVVELAKDPQLRSVISAEGRDLAARHANYATEMERLGKLYSALIAETR